MPRPRRTAVAERGDQLTLDRLGSMTAAEIRAAVAQLDLDLQDLHLDDHGGIRELDQTEQAAFDNLMVLRRRAEQHLRIREQVDRGAGVARAFAGDQLAQERPAILRPNQPLEDWLRSRGQLGDQPPAGGFDRYLRALVAGAPYGADAEQRALSEGTLTAGGHLVPTPLAARVIDLARNAMRVMQAGAVTVPMGSQTVKIPRLTNEGSPAWHAENAAITDVDLVFDSVTLSAKTLTRLVKLSIELFEDADPSAEDMIARSFAAQVALEVDRVALLGSGTSPEPRGVLNQSGVILTAHGANGSNITNYDWWLDAIGTVRAANFEPNAHIQAPRSSTSLSKLKEATTNAYLQPPAGLLPMLTSKQIPTNVTVGTSTDTSYIITADWSQLMIGIRTNLRILPLRERFIDNGQYGFLAWLRADVQLAQPAAFVVDTGVRA